MCCTVECHGVMLQAAGGTLPLRKAVWWAAKDVPLRAARTESAPGRPAQGPPPAPPVGGCQHTCWEKGVPGGGGSCHTLPSQHPGVNFQCQHHDSRGEGKETRQMCFVCKGKKVYWCIGKSHLFLLVSLLLRVDWVSVCSAVICLSFINITISMSVNEVCFTSIS